MFEGDMHDRLISKLTLDISRLFEVIDSMKTGVEEDKLAELTEIMDKLFPRTKDDLTDPMMGI
jgi:hypothetical protein